METTDQQGGVGPAGMLQERNREDGNESAQAEEQPQGRGRSTIQFPYAPLADAERIASELHGYAGTATPEGLAKALGQKSRSGAFRQKLSAARIFGLVSTRPNEVLLTRRGRQIIDPERCDAARVEAFLAVPLYKEIFEKYRGDLLPPAPALEAEMEGLGVSPKQTATARQVMQRSAETAGFSRQGSNRLVRPDNAQHENPPNAGREGGGGTIDALTALWETLLRDGANWSAETTKSYVDAARMLYKPKGDES